MPHVLEPLAQEEVHEQSKIITNDKKKKKVHRKREDRERERECIISESVQNIKHHLTRVLIKSITPVSYTHLTLPTKA